MSNPVLVLALALGAVLVAPKKTRRDVGTLGYARRGVGPEDYSEELLTCAERGCGNHALAYRHMVTPSVGNPRLEHQREVLDGLAARARAALAVA
jgi:hypothetical protein